MVFKSKSMICRSIIRLFFDLRFGTPSRGHFGRHKRRSMLKRWICGAPSDFPGSQNPAFGRSVRKACVGKSTFLVHGRLMVDAPARFFCLFLISADFRVLLGAPLAQNGPNKLQQMTHWDYLWSFLGPTRPTKHTHTHHNPTTPQHNMQLGLASDRATTQHNSNDVNGHEFVIYSAVALFHGRFCHL